jgi:hypothetical protein
MGQGERQMRNWGYASSGVGILMAVLTVISASLVLALHYDTIPFPISKIMAYVAIGCIVLAGSSFAFQYFAIARIQGADDVYTHTIYEQNHSTPAVSANSGLFTTASDPLGSL